MDAPRPASLWLALRLFRLPLEWGGAPSAEPCVVVDAHRVRCANAAADALGIHAGLRLAAALGMAPGLLVQERKPVQEQAALQRLACWAGGFTPEVCLAAEDELLLEIGGCLRLFGGLDVLLDAIRAGLQAQAYSFHMALAPTPLAAQWLVRAGAEARCVEPAALPEVLGPLPVAVMGLSARDARTLGALGVHALQDLFALPAAGLARRFGTGVPLRLAQALGSAPDPRARFVFPEHFAQGMELPAKVESAPMLLFAARRLLAGLAGWLGQRVCGVAECVLSMTHEDAAPTQLILAFAGATRDLPRMERVLRERLERLVLRQPAIELSLRADAPRLLPGTSLGLFAQAATEALDPVIERLRARLGQEAVHGLMVHPDHRPECASRPLPEGVRAETQCRPGPPRPLWLLARPQRLAERGGSLHRGGPLQRLAGPERIESGWWSGEAEGQVVGDVRRDYYVALSQAGEWLWIYRDEEGWWLHGFFA